MSAPAAPQQHPTSKAAIISHNRWMVGCFVADISAAGARLLVSRAKAVPDQIELQTALTGRLRRCRTVWREDGQVGVEFVDWA